MKITASPAGVKRVEHDLRFPIPQAVTIPLDVGGFQRDTFSLYLVTNGWKPAPDRPTDTQLSVVAAKVVEAINSTPQE